MVQSIIAGSKTQTRRVVKPPKEFIGDWFLQHVNFVRSRVNCPFGEIGDVLWVRETFCPTGSNEYLHIETNLPFFYKADVKEVEFAKEMMPNYGWKWKPSIFMPKDAARIWLKITAIRVERLNDISDEDAKNEGIKLSEHSSENVDLWYRYDDGSYTFLPQTSFRTLWESINGKDSWNSNPWVWVIEFERIEKPSKV